MDNYLAQNAQKKHKIFHCKCCDYSTSHSGMWNRHLKTKKHKDNSLDNNLSTKRTKSTKIWECDCGKTYKYQSRLCKHQNKCTYINGNEENQIITKNEETDMNTILTVMKELVFKQNKTLTEALKARKRKCQVEYCWKQ